MKRLVAIFVVIIVFIFGGCAALTNMTSGGVTVKELHCEYRVNPFGIDIVKPRLSWVMRSNQRGQMQRSYQILVASSKDLLDLNVGNLWDSGKVESELSNQVVYRGKPLRSRMQCYWKVRVWDKDNRISNWSETALWTMGLLNPKDWRADWIGYDKPAPLSYGGGGESDLLSLDRCKWIWYPEGEPQKSVPVGTRYFRRKIEISPDKKI